MKKNILEFIRRGIMASGFGPLILVVVYLALQRSGQLQSLSVNQVCTGIVSISALAFIVGSMNIIYRIERLPLMLAILIHGSVLYISYLATYLINGWLELGTTPVIVFTLIFILGYLAIWAGIYFFTKRNTARLNKILEENSKARGA